MHAKAFNVARRLSMKNENDLLQEPMFDDDDSRFSESYCQTLAEKLCAHDHLPTECNQYPTVLKELKRRNSNRSDHAVAFAGMSPGEAAAAMRAREKGQLNHAQIQRRLTNPHKKNP